MVRCAAYEGGMKPECQMAQCKRIADGVDGEDMTVM